MGELDNFLSNLTDHELAIFAGYRYHGFLNNSKEKITEEIKNRNLLPEKLDEYFNKKLPNKNNPNSCTQCGSGKLFIETDYSEKPISEFSSVVIATDTNRCRLCGFNPDKAPHRNFILKIKQFFGSHKHRRIEKWNEI